jgi:hypothetical protein
MSKPIVLSLDKWTKLHTRLANDNHPSVMLIREKMKVVLGFTVREHNEWVIKPDGGYGEHSIRLDFYNEPKRTMFLLKYGEYLDQS